MSCTWVTVCAPPVGRGVEYRCARGSPVRSGVDYLDRRPWAYCQPAHFNSLLNRPVNGVRCFQRIVATVDIAFQQFVENGPKSPRWFWVYSDNVGHRSRTFGDTCAAPLGAPRPAAPTVAPGFSARPQSAALVAAPIAGHRRSWVATLPGNQPARRGRSHPETQCAGCSSLRNRRPDGNCPGCDIHITPLQFGEFLDPQTVSSKHRAIAVSRVGLPILPRLLFSRRRISAWAKQSGSGWAIWGTQPVAWANRRISPFAWLAKFNDARGPGPNCVLTLGAILCFGNWSMN